MSRLRRILEGNAHRYIGGALAIVGHVMLGILAWRGSQFALVFLVVMSCFWTGLAVITGISWRRTLTNWENSLAAWEETQKLSGDYASLLGEACTALSTWDRETADDIVERALTIGRLRQANFNERNEE